DGATRPADASADLSCQPRGDRRSICCCPAFAAAGAGRSAASRLAQVPFGNDRQFRRQQLLPAECPLHLAAGRPGKHRGRYEVDCMRCYLESVADGLPDRRDRFRGLLLGKVPYSFLDNDKALAAIRIERKGTSTIQLHEPSALAGYKFDIV